MERAFSYHVTVAPANLPISLATLKEHLKLDPSDTSQDGYLTLIIEAVRICAEEEMKRILINTTFLTYRDLFNCCIELRKSKFQSLVRFKYLKDDILTTVSSDLYYITNELAYSSIYLKDGECYPVDLDNRFQAIEIEFVAGYGTTDASIPQDIKLALLNHAAVLYENRGDCDQPLTEEKVKAAIPATAALVYWKRRIRDFGNMCV